MCGIAAILLSPGDRSAAEWQAIREHFTRNLLFNEERGKAAAGLAVVQASGQITLFKAPLPASSFVLTEEYQAALAQVSAETVLLLGHTRQPTKGDPAYAPNNHPVQTGPVFGVHNGHISNDDALFAQFHYPRQGQVDSEIIFQMLAAVTPNGSAEHYLADVRPQLQLLKGQFTFLACDLRRPHQLMVLKHENPLCIHHHADWRALIFSSRYIFLRKAFGQSVITEALEHDQLMLFDATQIGAQGSAPAISLPLYALRG